MPEYDSDAEDYEGVDGDEHGMDDDETRLFVEFWEPRNAYLLRITLRAISQHEV